MEWYQLSYIKLTYLEKAIQDCLIPSCIFLHITSFPFPEDVYTHKIGQVTYVNSWERYFSLQFYVLQILEENWKESIIKYDTVYTISPGINSQNIWEKV